MEAFLAQPPPLLTEVGSLGKRKEAARCPLPTFALVEAQRTRHRPYPASIPLSNRLPCSL